MPDKTPPVRPIITAFPITQDFAAIARTRRTRERRLRRELRKAGERERDAWWASGTGTDKRQEVTRG